MLFGGGLWFVLVVLVEVGWSLGFGLMLLVWVSLLIVLLFSGSYLFWF